MASDSVMSDKKSLSVTEKCEHKNHQMRNKNSETEYMMAYYNYIFSEIINDEARYCGTKNWPSIAWFC